MTAEGRTVARTRRQRVYMIANGVAGLVLVALAVALWRDPGLAVRAEFERQRWALDAEKHAVEIDGHRVVYTELPADRADAPTVVMIHGFTGGKENWYRLAQGLRGKYRLLMPDLPGWGESERIEDEDYGYLAQSARVDAFVNAVSKTPVTLLGHSMGGGIAALAAARAPERIARVGLIDAAGVPFADNAFGLGVLGGENPFAVDDAASLQRYLETVFHDRSTIPSIPWPGAHFYIAQRRAQADFEQSVLERIGRSGERFMPGEAAERITQPALLLWCAQDVVIDPSAMQAYAERMPQARQVLLDGCGHMSIMERPGEVAQAVVMLVERAQPQRRE